jgi:hypothetical protein
VKEKNLSKKIRSGATISLERIVSKMNPVRSGSEKALDYQSWWTTRCKNKTTNRAAMVGLITRLESENRITVTTPAHLRGNMPLPRMHYKPHDSYRNRRSPRRKKLWTGWRRFSDEQYEK